MRTTTASSRTPEGVPASAGRGHTGSEPGADQDAASAGSGRLRSAGRAGTTRSRPCSVRHRRVRTTRRSGQSEGKRDIHGAAARVGDRVDARLSLGRGRATARPRSGPSGPHALREEGAGEAACHRASQASGSGPRVFGLGPSPRARGRGATTARSTRRAPRCTVAAPPGVARRTVRPPWGAPDGKGRSRSRLSRALARRLLHGSCARTVGRCFGARLTHRGPPLPRWGRHPAPTDGDALRSARLGRTLRGADRGIARLEARSTRARPFVGRGAAGRRVWHLGAFRSPTRESARRRG